MKTEVLLTNLLEKQEQLNDFIWSNREEGLPFVDKLTLEDGSRMTTKWFYERARVKGNCERVQWWACQFHRCFQSEMMELLTEEESGFEDMQNARVEMIDILHFVMCMGQVLGMEKEDWLNKEAADFKYVATDLMFIGDQYLNCFNWKHWSKDFAMTEQEWQSARLKVSEIFRLCLIYSNNMLLMNTAKINDLYNQKWQVNWDRQVNKYSKATKSDDNSKLEV